MPRLHHLLPLLLLAACNAEPAPPLAPPAERLAPPEPKSPAALPFVIQAEGSTVGFEMNAPIEKIRGRVPAAAVTGEISLDLADLTRSTGIVRVDLDGLELFQRRAADGGDFGEETKSDLQNEHAREWLEIGPSAPEEERIKNRRVEFALRQLRGASATDLRAPSGAEVEVTFTAEGELLLHQRKASKAAELALTVTFTGDRPSALRVRTRTPLVVGLAEYDVHPREAFGKLAAKTLEALSEKVARDVEISLDLVAVPAPPVP